MPDKNRKVNSLLIDRTIGPPNRRSPASAGCGHQVSFQGADKPPRQVCTAVGHEPTYFPIRGNHFRPQAFGRALGGLMGEWRNGLSTTRGMRPTAFDLPNISEEFGTERGARRTAGYAGR